MRLMGQEGLLSLNSFCDMICCFPLTQRAAALWRVDRWILIRLISIVEMKTESREEQQRRLVLTLKHLCSGVGQRANLSAQTQPHLTLLLLDKQMFRERPNVGPHYVGGLEKSHHWKQAQGDSHVDTSWSWSMKTSLQTPALSAVDESLRFYSGRVEAHSD